MCASANTFALPSYVDSVILEKEKIKILKLETTCNTRDLGGYETTDGKITKFKQFLRSDNTDRLTKEEIETLKNYGVKTVIDLRNEREILKSPDKFKDIEGVKYYNIKICPPKTLKRNATITEIYIETAKYTEGNGLKDIFDTIANAEKGTILFHCIYGKDRTGIVSALILRLADVSKEDISADYAKSYELMKNAESMKELISERDTEISLSEPKYIEALIDFIENTYGGIREYLLACGVLQENLNKIKNRFAGDF